MKTLNNMKQVERLYTLISDYNLIYSRMEKYISKLSHCILYEDGVR